MLEKCCWMVSSSSEETGYRDEGTAWFGDRVYSPEWLQRKDAVPVSLTLPLRPEPYLSKRLHPFFENLLPEGWLLEVSSKKLKISKDDAFGLLLATCRDCIGAVEIEPIDLEAF